ncbi:MAG: hypothetical protein KF743_01425 [Fimbriimonadaceae bacterium]|nr:hypothetical protein [Fimbriimonadaceae bacterium]
MTAFVLIPMLARVGLIQSADLDINRQIDRYYIAFDSLDIENIDASTKIITQKQNEVTTILTQRLGRHEDWRNGLAIGSLAVGFSDSNQLILAKKLAENCSTVTMASQDSHNGMLLILRNLETSGKPLNTESLRNILDTSDVRGTGLIGSRYASVLVSRPDLAELDPKLYCAFVEKFIIETIHRYLVNGKPVDQQTMHTIHSLLQIVSEYDNAIHKRLKKAVGVFDDT